MADPVSYRLDALTAQDCETLRQWRNTDEMRVAWRTPHVLTEEMQGEFYRNVVCNRDAPHRYWAVRTNVLDVDGSPTHWQAFVGMAGLSNIQWEPGLAEISLIVDPARSGQGIGGGAVELVLREAFERMRLLTVQGEVYHCNQAAIPFWGKIIEQYNGGWVNVPRRKFWDGKLRDAMLFHFTADRWRGE